MPEVRNLPPLTARFKQDDVTHEVVPEGIERRNTRRTRCDQFNFRMPYSWSEDPVTCLWCAAGKSFTASLV